MHAGTVYRAGTASLHFDRAHNMENEVTKPGPLLRRACVPVALALAAFTGLAHAQSTSGTVSPQQVRSWAAACASCHGTEGRALPGSPVPGLAGRPAADLTARMKAFKSSGAQNVTIMHQIAKGYTDEQIAHLSAYFAAVK